MRASLKAEEEAMARLRLEAQAEVAATREAGTAAAAAPAAPTGTIVFNATTFTTQNTSSCTGKKIQTRHTLALSLAGKLSLIHI